MEFDPTQIAAHVEGLEKGPIRYIAAVELVIILGLLGLLVRILIAQKTEVKELLNAERERALKLENTCHLLLQYVRMGAVAIRAGRPKLVKLSGNRILRGFFFEDLDPMGAESPTGPHKLALGGIDEE